MKCHQVQRLFDDLASGRLPEPLSQGVRQHLADCTDCRVQHQRMTKLQRLLALKRYERPAPDYFDSFLTDFKVRLEAEPTRTGFWRRAFAAADLEPLLSWRYGLATAGCLIGALALLWVGLGKSPATGSASAPAITVEPLIVTVGNPSPVSDDQLVSPRFELPLTHPVEVEPTISPGRPVLATTVAHHVSTPHYVLERVSITPATYDVPIDF